VDGNRAEDSGFVMPGGGGAPSVVRDEVRGGGAVARGADERWNVSGRAGQVALGATPVVLPSGVLVPTKLWHLQAGAGYTREQGGRRRWGANASLGSASDRPFDSFGEVSGAVSAFRQIPSGARASWILMLNYSNNRTFLNNVPLPGAAYLTRSEDGRVTLAAGFPFLYLRWRPDDAWTLTANDFGFANAYAVEAERRVSGALSAYARVERDPLQWLRAGRSASTDRLIFDSGDVRAGARAALGAVTADFSGGRTFARSFSEGKPSSRATAARTTLPNGWLATARLSWRWGETPRPRD